MTTERFANQAATTLVSAIGAGDLSITVQSAAHFPVAPEFRIRLSQELMLVTGVAGTTWTVTRGIEGTSAASHAIGTAVTAVLTAGGLDEMRSEIEGEHLTAGSLASATTTVVVSAATAPTAGQVLTATSSTAADWETPSAASLKTTTSPVVVSGATAPTAGQVLTATSSTTAIWAGQQTLSILYCGDSHTNGVMDAADSLLLSVFLAPKNAARNRMWTASGFAPIALAQSGIGRMDSLAPHPNHNGNVVSTAPGCSWVGAVPDLIRERSPNVKIVDYCNYGYGGTSTFDWSGNVATGSYFVSGVGTAGDTLVVGGTTYTLHGVIYNTYPGWVLIGGTQDETAQNLAYAINKDPNHTSKYDTTTPINANVFCPVVASSNIQTLFARDVGAAGNARTIAGTGAIGIFAQTAGGDNTPNVIYNMQTDLAAAGGFGTPDVIVYIISTNDVYLNGFCDGVGYAAHLAASVGNLHALYPSAKIIIAKTLLTSVAQYNTRITSVVNPAVVALAAANPSYLSVVDLTDLPAGTGAYTLLNPDSGIHLYSYGYLGPMANAVADAIVTALAI
jgi:hypothetical protein